MKRARGRRCHGTPKRSKHRSRFSIARRMRPRRRRRIRPTPRADRQSTRLNSLPLHDALPISYGAYAQSLAEMIRTGGLSLPEVFNRVRLRVNETSKGAQVPWDAEKIEASFTFFDRAPDAPAPAPQDQATAARRSAEHTSELSSPTRRSSDLLWRLRPVARGDDPHRRAVAARGFQPRAAPRQ